jgi:ferric-dicitrate binding protein FerR (iron transport regulator)
MKKISTEDFINDPVFRRWVKNPNPELNNYWKNWIQNNPESRSSFEEARFYLNSIQFSQNRLESLEKEQLYQRINQTLRKRSKQIPVLTVSNSLWFKIAAGLTLLMGLLYGFLNFNEQFSDEYLSPIAFIEKTAPIGSKISVRLPDGSLVKLNAGSSVRYPGEFEGNERKIELHGEAYFEVEKDPEKPFLVQAGMVSVQALGTAFSVLNEASIDSICISLTEGSVLVSTEGTASPQSVQLEQGQTAAYRTSSNKLNHHNFLDDRLIGWIDNTIVFKDSEWQEVRQILEKWYGVEISTTKKLEGWKYSARFKDYPLENILKSICFTNNLNYELSEYKVRIY